MVGCDLRAAPAHAQLIGWIGQQGRTGAKMGEAMQSFDKEATAQVSQWICNDRDWYEQARQTAIEGDVSDLDELLTGILNDAGENSVPWYTRRRYLSDHDMERIDWSEVASDLIGD